MDTNTFWSLIDSSRKSSKGDFEIQQEQLVDELMKLGAEQIIAYDKLFTTYFDHAYQWKLWAAAHTILGGCSDDCFDDFRGWLIAQGKEVYDAALENPDSLVEVAIDTEMDFEGFAYCAYQAYEDLTDEELPEDEERKSLLDPIGEEWDENDLPVLVPRLYKKYK
ncbi:MAG: DUF4240 domain-containing protein [Bacteroidota bacterium]